MSAYLPGLEGEQRRADLSQWYTPPKLADRMVRWLLEHHPEARWILDPAAGHGALLAPFLAIEPTGMPFWLRAWDIDPGNVEALRAMPAPIDRRARPVDAELLDFEAAGPRQRADAVICNPPYEDGLDVACILAGITIAPVVVALLRGVVRHGVDRWERLWRHVDIVREVVLIERPRFGGRFTPATDFVVLELQRAQRTRDRGEPMPPHPVEWW